MEQRNLVEPTKNKIKIKIKRAAVATPIYDERTKLSQRVAYNTMALLFRMLADVTGQQQIGGIAQVFTPLKV